MKKITNFILALTTTIALIPTTTSCTQTHETGYTQLTKHTVITNDNSSLVAVRISKIKKLKHGRKIYVTCYDNEYDGHVYSLILSSQEIKSWKKEQGKIKKGMKTTVILYKCNTATIEDDVIVNIRKGWC